MNSFQFLAIYTPLQAILLSQFFLHNTSKMGVGFWLVLFFQILSLIFVILDGFYSQQRQMEQNKQQETTEHQ